MPAVADELLTVALGPGHDRAGGVDDVEARVRELAHDPLADAVGGDGHPSLLDRLRGGAAHIAIDLVGPGQLPHAG